MEEVTHGGFMVESRWTWKEKLKARLFPVRWCELPEAPAEHKDVLITNTLVSLDWLDRLRIAVSGQLQVETRTVTEHVVGYCATESVVYVLPPKMFSN